MNLAGKEVPPTPGVHLETQSQMFWVDAFSVPEVSERPILNSEIASECVRSLHLRQVQEAVFWIFFLSGISAEWISLSQGPLW